MYLYVQHLTYGVHRPRTTACQVTSWDTSTNAPDEDETDGRSYISAVSEIITDDTQNCEGRAKTEMGEARMDIEDSEMAYLGYQGSEAYGLTWKVSQRNIYIQVYIYMPSAQYYYTARQDSNTDCPQGRITDLSVCVLDVSTVISTRRPISSTTTTVRADSRILYRRDASSISMTELCRHKPTLQRFCID